ncbi:MAG: hypothetical protein IKT34_00110, partial [Clostridia bacterium]|nr:hypothetical protein [Clostridia bacterium]
MYKTKARSKIKDAIRYATIKHTLPIVFFVILAASIKSSDAIHAQKKGFETKAKKAKNKPITENNAENKPEFFEIKLFIVFAFV